MFVNYKIIKQLSPHSNKRLMCTNLVGRSNVFWTYCSLDYAKFIYELIISNVFVSQKLFGQTQPSAYLHNILRVGHHPPPTPSYRPIDFSSLYRNLMTMDLHPTKRTVEQNPQSDCCWKGLRCGICSDLLGLSRAPRSCSCLRVHNQGEG